MLRSVRGRFLIGLAVALLAAGCGLDLPGSGQDCSTTAEADMDLAVTVADDFEVDGPLAGWVTNNADVLPDVEATEGRYRALLEDNTDDKTLHFFSSQGRLDARLVAFPFDVVVRNIGIGTPDDSQVAPAPVGDETYIFAGVQVHDAELDAANSSHVVIGHRGGTHFTVEGKNTCDGTSVVDDAGPDTAPTGRADLRIVGEADGTLTVYHQDPNPEPGVIADDWRLYNGTGILPGTAPGYGNEVYIGLITYAQGQAGLPFVGTADAVELGPGS